MFFYFMLKALFVLEIFKFLSWIFGYVEKQLDKKTVVHFKIYDATDWAANNYYTHIAQISRSKNNHTMRFAQLIEYKMRNIFLEKSYTKCVGKASPRSFYRKLKLSISLD